MRDLDSILLKTDELAALLDLTPRRIRQLTKEGMLQRSPSRQFPLQSSVLAYLRVKAQPEVAGWLVRKARADALLREHALARAEVLRQDPMQLWPLWLDTWNGLFQAIVQTVMGSLPPRIAALGGLDPYDVREVLRDHLFPLLEHAADELEDRTAEPHRTRFRELREREAAVLAQIRVEEAERAAQRALNKPALDQAVARAGGPYPNRQGNGSDHE